MSKKSRSEANKVAMAIKSNKSEYYIADVDLEDDSADVIATAPAIRKILGKVNSGFLIISAGITHLTVVVDTSGKDLSAKDWLNASLEGIGNGVCNEADDNDENCARKTLQIDQPFKLKDVVRSSAFSFLRKNGCLEEESEEEEYYEF